MSIQLIQKHTAASLLGYIFHFYPPKPFAFKSALYLCGMKQTLIENKGLPASLLWALAIIAGITVANLYYNQPLLYNISQDLQVSEFKTNLIAMVTQIGYALGLLFIIPLGDLFPRRKIILVNFSILILSLLSIALSPNLEFILLASFFTGLCSIMPQIFIPIAAQFSTPETKGKNVGIIVSGLLTGILGSRVVSGIVGEIMGWRFMFFAAAVLMILSCVFLLRVMPDIQSNFEGKYKDLMKSLLQLVKDYPVLRVSALRSGLAFGSFLALWSCLAFRMEQAPFYAGSHVTGLLGLCGVAGAMTASFVGRYVRKVGVKRFNYIGCGLILLAWICLSYWGDTYAGIISGILLFDVGMQCIQLSNQTTIFSLNPKASNRINTIFMTTYFAGGSLGTFLAGSFWSLYGWDGVVGAGLILIGCSFLLNLFFRKEIA